MTEHIFKLYSNFHSKLLYNDFQFYNKPACIWQVMILNGSKTKIRAELVFFLFSTDFAIILSQPLLAKASVCTHLESLHLTTV